MKHFFIIFGFCGIISMAAVSTALFIGLPSESKIVTKTISVGGH